MLWDSPIFGNVLANSFPSPMETFPPLDWALFWVENICLVVGVPCEGNKD